MARPCSWQTVLKGEPEHGVVLARKRASRRALPWAHQDADQLVPSFHAQA